MEGGTGGMVSPRIRFGGWGEGGCLGDSNGSGNFQWLLVVGAIAVAVAALAFLHCNLTISSQNCFGVCGRVVCFCDLSKVVVLHTHTHTLELTKKITKNKNILAW